MAYTQSQSYSGQGTKLEFCLYITSPIVFQDPGEPLTFSPQGKMEMSDPTNLSSSSREKKPALYDAGNLKTSVNRVPTNAAQLLLEDAYINKKLMWIRATLAPNLEVGQVAGDVYLYTGYCVQNEPDVQVGKHIVNQFELALTRRVSFTPGATS